jgi:hypothetical protein
MYMEIFREVRSNAFCEIYGLKICAKGFDVDVYHTQ